jgi:hypothetical protein
MIYTIQNDANYFVQSIEGKETDNANDALIFSTHDAAKNLLSELIDQHDDWNNYFITSWEDLDDLVINNPMF